MTAGCYLSHRLIKYYPDVLCFIFGPCSPIWVRCRISDVQKPVIYYRNILLLIRIPRITKRCMLRQIRQQLPTLTGPTYRFTYLRPARHRELHVTTSANSPPRSPTPRSHTAGAVPLLAARQKRPVQTRPASVSTPRRAPRSDRHAFLGR